MERFFATFAAGNAQKLNEVISKYAEDNSYIEVNRSQPSTCYDEHYGDVTIAVTSTFRNMTEAEKQMVRLTKSENFDPSLGDPDGEDDDNSENVEPNFYEVPDGCKDFYSDIAEPRENL